MREKMSVIGILALQGGVAEHLAMIERCGAIAKEIRTPEDLVGISGILLPGGESTAIGKLLVNNHLFFPLREAIEKGLPAWGTCAGAILLAKEGSEFSLGLADFGVRRNGFGRQVASFRENIAIEGIEEKFPAIFIRAPRFENLKKDVEIRARWNGEPIFLQQKNIWATSFHPELSDNPAAHRHFVEFCKECGVRL